MFDNILVLLLGLAAIIGGLFAIKGNKGNTHDPSNPRDDEKNEK